MFEVQFRWHLRKYDEIIEIYSTHIIIGSGKCVLCVADDQMTRRFARVTGLASCITKSVWFHFWSHFFWYQQRRILNTVKYLRWCFFAKFFIDLQHLVKTYFTISVSSDLLLRPKCSLSLKKLNFFVIQKEPVFLADLTNYQYFRGY